MEISQRKRRGMGGGNRQKRRRESRRDRISELPDEIQRHILSFLTTKTAVQTSVLSKQWRRTWAFSPILNFDQREFASVADFVSFADRAVVLHGGSSLERLELSWHDGFDMLKAEMWFKYAMRRNVEELLLDIPSGRSRPLPSFLFYGCAKIHFYSSTVV